MDLSSCDGTFRRAVTALDQPIHGWTGFQMLVGDVSGDHRADIAWNFAGWINATYVSLSQL